MTESEWLETKRQMIATLIPLCGPGDTLVICRAMKQGQCNQNERRPCLTCAHIDYDSKLTVEDVFNRARPL